MAEETKVIRIIVDSSRAVDGSAAATRAWERMEKAQGQAAASMDRMEAALGRVGGYLKAQLAFFVADAANRLLQMAKGALDAAANMGELADQLGISVKGLQGLQFAAVQNNLKLEQLETGVAKFSQKIGEAAGGSKEMITALNNIGVKILDTQGKLRPTEELMQNVAAAILAIDDPAKRAAAAVDFFGKAGTRMLPMLPAIAKGMDDMAESARRAGAMISDEAIAKLDKLSDAGARTQLVMRAMFAESAAGPLTEALDFINRKIENMITLLKEASGNLTSLLAAAANPGVFAARIFGSTPAEKMASDIAAQQKAIAGSEAALANLGANDIRRQYTQSSLDRARETLAALQRQQGVAAIGGRTSALPADPDNIGILVAQRPGAGNPKPTGGGGGGETPEQKYAKLTVKLQEAARAQDEMTAAAARGDVAFTSAQVHLDAVQKTLEIFGKRLADNDPLLVELEARLLRIAQGKAAEAFSVATTELEKQNAVLEAQIRLMGEPPELIAREIAAIKSKQDIEKAGGKITQEEIDRRYQAVEAGERLKSQADELRKAQELWTEPLKQALRDIQSTAADAFQQMLESGKFSFEALGQTFKKIVTRMAAEFLALATIRPVMSVLVNAISPSMARQMGLGTGGAGGGVGLPSVGGGSLLGGSGSGWLGGIGDWLGSPIGGFGGALNTSASSPASFMAPAGATGATLGGITWGQGLGALAGAGMGAYQLLSGGGSTASTIGGIASLVGAGVSLIPGIGQIAGPLIALAGGLLPGLFGESKPTITDQAYGQLAYGSGGFGTSGGAWGPNANASSLQGPLSQIGGTMQAIFDAFGGVKEAGRVWGVAMESFSQQYGDGNSFSNQTSFLVGPNGERRQWGMGSNASDIGMEAAGVAATLSSILDGAVGDISDNMRKALEGVNKSGKDTLETVGTVVAEVMAYDDALKNLGKTTTEAESALKAIDDSFRAMFDTAAKYSFDTAVLEEAKAKERLRVSTDFAAAIDRQLMDPLTRALTEIGDERTALLRNNSALMAVEGHLDQSLKIEDLYLRKRNEIMDQANAASLAAQRQASAALVSAMAGSVSRIQDLIRELSPGGALSNLDPAGQLAGLRASASASLAQAFANPSDASLIDRAVSDQRAFLEFNRSFTGGSTAYVRDQQAALSQLQALQGASTQGAIGGAGDPAVRNLLQRLLTAVQQSNDNSAKRSSDIDKVIGLLARYLANEAA